MIKKRALAAGLWAAGTLLVLAAPAQAALIFFDNRADFELASGLSGITEDFEEANVGVGTVEFTSSPLNSATNDGIFSFGDIADGLTILSSDDSDVAVLGSGILGLSKMVGSSNFDASTVLLLSPAVLAIGFDVFLVEPANIAVSVFDENGLSLGSTTVSGLGNATPNFLGIVSDMSGIARLTIDDLNIGAEAVDNVTFGNPVAAQLPEPGSLALFGLGLLGLGVAVRRRHCLARPHLQSSSTPS